MFFRLYGSSLTGTTLARNWSRPTFIRRPSIGVRPMDHASTLARTTTSASVPWPSTTKSSIPRPSPPAFFPGLRSVRCPSPAREALPAPASSGSSARQPAPSPATTRLRWLGLQPRHPFPGLRPRKAQSHARRHQLFSPGSDQSDVPLQLGKHSRHRHPLGHQLANRHRRQLPRVYAGSDYNLGIRSLAFDHEKLNPTPVATSFFPRAPISQMSLSSSGSTPGTGILWVISSPTGTVASYPGILYAFDAETLEMLYSSETNPFDRLGDYPRFNAPTIADGKVFVPTFTNKLVVYGLCSKNPRSACQCQVCQHR